MWKPWNSFERVWNRFMTSFRGSWGKNVISLSSLSHTERKGGFWRPAFKTWTSNIIEWMLSLWDVFESNTHCYYCMEYWRNWWHQYNLHLEASLIGTWDLLILSRPSSLQWAIFVLFVLFLFHWIIICDASVWETLLSKTPTIFTVRIYNNFLVNVDIYGLTCQQRPFHSLSLLQKQWSM